MVHNKRLDYSVIRVTIMTNIGFLGSSQTTACLWRLLVDGNEATTKYFWNHSSPYYGWFAWRGVWSTSLIDLHAGASGRPRWSSSRLSARATIHTRLGNMALVEGSTDIDQIQNHLSDGADSCLTSWLSAGSSTHWMAV